MLDLIFLMIGCLVIGYFSERNKKIIISGCGGIKEKISYRLLMIIIVVWFVLISGLRTRYNDTATYIHTFNLITEDISFSIKDLVAVQYYGFEYWQRIIKHFTDNPQWLIMVNAIVCVGSFLRFYIKYSKTLTLTLLCYITIGTYVFSMGAQKQVLAMSISLFAIEFLLQKKYVRFYLLIILAYTFHPYILTLAVLPLLLDNVWSKRMIKITIFVALLAFVFTQVIEIVLSVADTMGVGKDYTVEEMTSHTINPLRVIIDGVPILISWFLRDKINQRSDRLYKLGFNMMIVMWLMTFTSLFANPIYVYRTGQYFSSLNPIVIPWMLVYCLPENRYKKLFITGYMLIYAAFCTQQIIQFGGYSIFYDPFKHTTLSSLFQ